MPYAGARAWIAAAAVMALSGAPAAAAEGDWWDGIQGFGPPGSRESYSQPRPAGDDEPRKASAGDLRKDETPWRSEAMLEGLDLAIERYQTLANKSGWSMIPTGRILRPGDDDERVPLLRRRLWITGELKSRETYYGGYESTAFDQDLEAAVKLFQTRNGLRISGRADQPTIEALNVPIDARVAQLRLNRDRIRNLLQQRIEDRYILVNVPAFQLEAVENNEARLRRRVIVGRSGRDTPELKATIRNLNFFPYWKVPDSVAKRDLIPKLVKEPGYLDAEKIRVLAGDFNGSVIDHTAIDWSRADGDRIKFRQDPGPQNALGLVRIDMSNEHGVYMHDTPLKKLFDQRQRAFSAGCVRVQGVFELVEWIASREPGWEQPGRVAEVLDAGQALDLQLTRPVPVYFTYITAWAEPDGHVEFRGDIYGRDGSAELSAGLGHSPDEPPPPAVTLTP